MQPPTRSFLTHLSRSPEATLAAIADNGRFDERASFERWQGFEGILHGVLAVGSSRSLAIACALPTVLDGGMHKFFFPAPREHPFGATLHLAGLRPIC